MSEVTANDRVHARPGWQRDVLLSALSALFFGYLAFDLIVDFLTEPDVHAWDRQIEAVVRAARGPLTTQLMRGVTVLGNTPVAWALTTLVVLLLWARRRRVQAVFVAVTVAGGALISATLKQLLDRPRPPAPNALIELPSSFSMPSGHAVFAVCFFGSLIVVAWPEISSVALRVVAAAAAVLAVLLVGASRVYLGVHWPSDVLAGWYLGAMWLSVTLCGYHIRRRHWVGAKAAAESS